jgi:hypothetical protein
MKGWYRFPGAGGACLLAAALAAAGEKRAPARVYTDEDLARVSGRRGETGVESTPAAPPPPEEPVASNASSGRGESYWRGEAARLRERVGPWREAIADLRVEIAARQALPGVLPYTDPKVRAWQRKVAALEARIRDAEDRFEERARRAGAMPGWLR